MAFTRAKHFFDSEMNENLGNSNRTINAYHRSVQHSAEQIGEQIYNTDSLDLNMDKASRNFVHKSVDSLNEDLVNIDKEIMSVASYT